MLLHFAAEHVLILIGGRLLWSNWQQDWCLPELHPIGRGRHDTVTGAIPLMGPRSRTGPAATVRPAACAWAPADHTRWRPLLPYLEPDFTVHVMDRRGRGGSGDGPEYDIAREYEDVVAVVDAIAGATGSRVNLHGHSHGGIVAFEAATLTANLRRS